MSVLVLEMTGRSKYTLEALRLKLQVNALLSSQLAHHDGAIGYKHTNGSLQ